MKRLSTVGLLGAMWLAAATASAAVPEPKTDFDAGIDVRYPKDLRVVPISDKTPEGLRKFAGRWAGQYNGVMNVIVTFEKLDDANAVMYVHSVGVTPAYNILRKLTDRPREAGKYDPGTGTITANFTATQTQILRITEEGWLENQYEEKGQWKSLGILKRVQDFPGQPSGAPTPAPFKITETTDK